MEFQKDAYLQNVKSARDYIRQQINEQPVIGIILGSGQNELVSNVKDPIILSGQDIPGFPAATVSFHRGKVIFGWLGDKYVAILQGRYHYYEGHSMQTITLPVRILNALGIQILLVTNAAGGLNPNYHTGDLVIIRDHINFMSDSPLIGLNYEDIGPLFPDMNFTYDANLIELLKGIFHDNGLQRHTGVYCSVKGPQMETPAEQKMLRMLGGDLVGMSTVPEIITGRQLGMRCAGISVVTNQCTPDMPEFTTVEHVVENAGKVDEILSKVLIGCIQAIS